MNNIDPLIRREFERLGLNIVENEALADLVITRANRQRLKLIALCCGSALAVVALLAGLYLAFTSTNNPSTPASGKLLSFSQDKNSSGLMSLPQAGYIDIDGSNPAKAQATFVFQLEQGWIIQEITDNPDPILGEAGTVDVFRVEDGKDVLVQRYSMSSRTQINEFGVQRSGVHKFVLNFNNPNFKGRVRVAFVRSN
jgi:hypothetical protein